MGVVGFRISLRLVKSLFLKDYVSTIHPLYHLSEISKFNILLFKSVARNCAASRSNFERLPQPRGDPGVHGVFSCDAGELTRLCPGYGVR